MNNRIVYQSPGNQLCILTPCDCGLTIKEIATKDVPEGVPYWIVPSSDIDAMYAAHGDLRNAWEIDEASVGRPADGKGGAK